MYSMFPNRSYFDFLMISEHNKEIAVKRVAAGEQITKVCHDIGVSRGSLYTWIKRYNKDGVAGLFPLSRRPQSNSNSLDKDSISIIYNTALDNPADDIRSLKKILDNKGHPFSISTIHKYLNNSNISTREERKILLLLWLELDGEENLGAQRVRGLETLSRHFAERNNIAARSGEKYYVSIEYLQTGSQPQTEIRVWHFMDLYSFHVTSIIEDYNEWDDKSRDHYKNFLESSGIREDHAGHYCFPIFVWWKAYVEKQNPAPIRLILSSTDFFTVSQKKLLMQLPSTKIKLKFDKTGSTLPQAFISDFRCYFRKKYSNLTLHLSKDEPIQKRYRFFSQYIGRSLTTYNNRNLSALFPMSRATPNTRSHLSEKIKQNPSVELSHFLDSWRNGKELFQIHKDIDLLSGDEGGWYGTGRGCEEPKRYGRTGIDEELSLSPNLEFKHINRRNESPGGMDGDFGFSGGSKGGSETSGGRYGRQGLPAKRMAQQILNEKADQMKKNAFIRAQQEIDIKKYTNMDDPTCDLRKMNDRVPFKIVYEMLMDEKPKGKYWTCPRCGKKAMSYYPNPNGKHVNNHGYCHPNQAGCGNPTNSVNLLKLKSNYQFPQALKWLLANFNPGDYEVIPEFYLSDKDKKEYQHRA